MSVKAAAEPAVCATPDATEAAEAAEDTGAAGMWGAVGAAWGTGDGTGAWG